MPVPVIAKPAAREVEGYRLHPRQWQVAALLGLTNTVPIEVPVKVKDDGTTEPQWVEELLFGGAAGPGKSHLLRAVGTTICSTWPGAVVTLFRRTYPELEETHLRSIVEELPEGIAVYRASRHEMRFSNGSVFAFRHAEDEKAVFGYKSAQWSALLIDQCEEFTEFQIRFLRHRVRQPKAAFSGKWRRIIVDSANPGGISHQYLRDGFVAPTIPGTVFTAPEKDGGLRRAYVPARLADNPTIDKEEYVKVLKGLPDHLVRAYLEGDWDGVPGAYFTQFRANTVEGDPHHVWPLAFARQHYGVPDDKPFPPRDWTFWCGIDGGYSDPWVTLWLARAPDRRIFVFHEMYETRVDIPEQAARIRKYQRAHEIPVLRFVADPAMFANRANRSVSDAQVYQRERVVVERGNNKRQQGWRRVAEALSHLLDDEMPELVFLEGCVPQLQRTLPLLMVDKLDREDISDQHGSADPASLNSIRDDTADALRYAIVPSASPDVSRRAIPIETSWGNERNDAGTGLDMRYDDGGEPLAELNQSGMYSHW